MRCDANLSSSPISPCVECAVARAAPHEMGVRVRLVSPGGLSVWLPHFTPFYRLARNAQSSVKLTPLQSVNRGQDLWVSSIINEAEEMPFLQGTYWTFFDNRIDIQLWLWTPNSAVTALPRCLLIKKWVWKYFNSLEIPDPSVGPGVSPCPLYEHEIETKWTRGSREHQAPLIGHNGGQTPFIGDQIFGTIFHSLQTWNMNNVNCAFWGVKLINILRFIVNDRFGG